MALQVEHERLSEANGQLLQQLQIACEQRESRAVPPRREWVATTVVFAVVLPIGAPTVFVLRRLRLEVETATAVPPAMDAAPKYSSRQFYELPAT
jgi:hypothetical protein